MTFEGIAAWEPSEKVLEIFCHLIIIGKQGSEKGEVLHTCYPNYGGVIACTERNCIG